MSSEAPSRRGDYVLARGRRRLRPALVVLATFATIVLAAITVVPTPAYAAHNVNFDGEWSMSGSQGASGVLSVVNEDLASGSFGGTATFYAPTHTFVCQIKRGRVTGNQFTLIAAYPGSIGDITNIQFDYVGSINGNSMNYTKTDVQFTMNGRLYNRSQFVTQISGSGTGTRVANIIVSAVAPSVGLAAGGTDVTLSGKGFDAATGVDFVLAGGATVAASSFNVVDGTTITAVTPSVKEKLASGTNQVVSDVIVSVNGDKSSAGAVDKFTFQNVSVTKLSSTSGLAQGGQTVTVTGTGFIGVTGVTFAPADSASFNASVGAASFHVDTPTSMTLTSPSATRLIAAGTSKVLTDLVVSVGSEQSTASTSDHYTFEYLQLTKVTPVTGPIGGGTHVALKGQDFKQVTDVVFVYDAKKPGVPAPFTALSDKKIVLTAPSMLPYGTKGTSRIPTDIIVTVGNFATKAHATDQFTFSELSVKSLSPTSGPLGGATKVTLSGSGFTGATRVTLTNGTSVVSATPVVKSDSSLSFVTPSIVKLTGLKGLAFNVTVAVGSTSSAATKSAVFTYRAPPS
ncbi:MAG: IPT/TIG domain-containing protein [Acidimicrobiales bacterium]